MARKPIPLDCDDLVRRYEAGETVLELADSVGVSHTTVQKRLRERGVLRKTAEDLSRHKRESMISLDVESIVARYRSGEAAATIAASFGVSQIVIDRRLRDAGVIRRTRSEVLSTMFAGMTPEERSAHTARPERLAKCARTRAESMSMVGAGEDWLVSALRRAGLSVAPQAAVDRYNVDALVEAAIAVELMTDSCVPYAGKPKHARRVKHLLKRHCVLVVWSSGRFVLCPKGMKKIVALCKQLSGDPASACHQYWMIRGDGELAVRGDHPNDRPRIRSARYRNGVRGSHER